MIILNLDDPYFFQACLKVDNVVMNRQGEFTAIHLAEDDLWVSLQLPHPQLHMQIQRIIVDTLQARDPKLPYILLSLKNIALPLPCCVAMVRVLRDLHSAAGPAAE